MNVLIKYIFILFLFMFPSAFSFNVCNVDISETNAFIINDSINNKQVLIVDSQGDIYLEGVDHSLVNYNTEKSLYLSNFMYFNRVTSKFNNFLQDRPSVPETNSLLIKNSAGVSVASFNSNDNNIYTKGKGVYEGSQASCSADGNYCSGGLLENRDYFCDLTGSKTGSCSYNTLSSENCLTKASIESDGGSVYTTIGTVTDYTGCSITSCTYNSYTDSCSSSTNLIEYYSSGSSYGSINYNCASTNSNYCSGTNIYRTNTLCGSGKCSAGTSTFVQSCVATTTTYGSWSCIDINTKIRTNIVYSPSCSGGACVSNYNPIATPESVSCGGGNYCSGGVCNTITYSWVQGGFGSCSASCGPGTQTQSVSCKRDYDGVTVGDSFCNSATKPATSQSCNLGSCCGNGILNIGEICDTTNLNGNSCTTLGQGFTGGILSCNSACSEYVTSSCTTSFSQEGNGCDNCPFGSYYYRSSGVFEDGSSGDFYACYLNGNWISKSSYFRGIRYSKYTQAINDPSACEQKVYINGIYRSTQTYSWKIASGPPAQECTIWCSNW